MPHIHVVTTGGTIDKVYSLAGELVIGPPSVDALLSPVLTDLTYDVTPVVAVDSLDMTDVDRAALCRAIDGLTGRLVVVTHGTDTLPETAAFLDEHLAAADQTVVLTGGVRTPSDALAGPVAEAAIATLNVDVLFLGVHGMSPRTGFTTPNLMEAGINRLLVNAARRLVVLADHTKWETVGIATIARLDDADILVTDSGLPPEARSQLADRVGELVIVEVDRSE
jgi:DeoR/GlpR family transcriptional regulator of sugar metabolism